MAGARAAWHAARYAVERLEDRRLLAGNGPVVVSEIMYHAASQNPLDEWVELYNTGTQPVNLSGWHFGKGLTFTFGATTLNPGAYLVVARDLARFQSTHAGVTNVVGGYTGQLGNNGDTIEVDDSTGAVVDQFDYGTEGDWAVRRRGPNDLGHLGWVWQTNADGLGSSMELVNPALGNDSGQNWKPSTVAGGTPGAANSTASANIAPMVLDMQQVPLVPKSTDTVTISARMVDEQATGVTATLRWRLDGATSFNAVTMFDDGAHGDGGAGDGVYAAQIPAQANNAVVEYYLQATDAFSNSRTWPGPTDTVGTQGANLLYQVDNSAAYTGGQPFFKFVMTEAERAELAAIGAPGSAAQNSNALMNATFIATDGAGTEVRFTSGLRNRGGGSADDQPNNYHLRISNDHTWRGVRALNINGRWVQEDVTGSAVMRAAGLPSQNVLPVQVRVNNANLASTTQYDMYGSYSYVQAENSDLVNDQFPADSQGNYYRGVDAGHNATLAYLGTTPSSYFAKYPKETNSEVNDYSDLIDLTQAFDSGLTPDANFVSRISARINVTNWLRYFAANTLIGNRETTLGTGVGDDFAMYRGVTDTRFQLVNHDLDTILGRGDTAGIINDSIFRATAIPAAARLLRNPAFAPLYYAQLRELATTTFAAANINALLDNTLKGFVPQANIDSMKTFAAQRVANVLSQIPTGVTATSTLAVQNGYPRSAVATTNAISGTADSVLTRSVRVNGVAATYTPAPAATTGTPGTWQAPTISLNPGINRVVVQALDANNNEVGRTSIDVWYDKGTTTNVSGTLPAGTTQWTAAGGPYRVTANLTVPANGVLVIAPGTSVFFDAGVRMTVNGQLTAAGTDTQRISFVRTPTAASAWDRVLVSNTQQDSKIAYAVFENAGSGSENIQVSAARLDMDHLEWLGTTTHLVDMTDSSFRLTNSVTPDTVGVEGIHFKGDIPAGGYALIQGNTFGRTTGHNDVIDFTGGNRPGPILQVLDNTFLGAGGDDLLDLDSTDAHIEGNVFMNVPHSTAADTSSAISGGVEPGLTDTSEIVSVRNFFYNVDHGFLMKEGNSVTSINDTFVNVFAGVFNFSEPGFAPDPGVGGFAVGAVFYNVPVVNGVATIVQNPPTGSFTVSKSIVNAGSITVPGTGNQTADPHLANTTSVTNPRVDFQLRGGPAVGTGPNGRDMGAAVAGGASISGEPSGTTYQTSATLTVGGPDIYAYKYKINNGAFSAEVPVTNAGTAAAVVPPIQLSGLANGTYTVYVVAKNSAGFYQADASATASKTWNVSAGSVRLVINEVLADRSGGPDQIELYNQSATARDVSGMGITDDPTKPTKFVFPAGTAIPANGYLVLNANDPDGSGGIHTGFALDKDGEGVYLYNSPAAGGGQVDGVTFGRQLTNLSIGRAADGTWALNVPTLGAANVAQPVGDPSKLKINEWLTEGLPPFNDDFVELYNPDPNPVALGGLSLTDSPITWPDRSPIPALSFMPAAGYASFVADGKAGSATHANFKLAHEQGMIGLFDAGKKPIDIVVYGDQKSGVSQGRSPDGALTYGSFLQPSPGVANVTSPTPTPTPTPIRVVELNYHPGGSSGANFTADDYEYVEVKNTGTSPVDLTGMQFTAGIAFTFPSYTLPAGGVGVVVKNPAAFANRYGTGVPVIGTFTDTLADGGEQVRLVTAAGNLIQDFSYSNTWYKSTDGDGYTLQAVNPAADPATASQAAYWRPSRFVFGSPGTDESAAAVDSVVVNEVLSHSHGASGDYIELRNTTGSPIDISGWYLSDSAASLLKYQVPAGKVVPANGYLVLTEFADFGAAFQFSENGDEAWLTASTTPGVESGYRQGVSFGGAASDVPFGRYATSTGAVDFTALKAQTPGAANAGPAVGPVVINELMYNPAGTAPEFIELRNLTNAAVPLYDPANPSNVWKFTHGVNFNFSTGDSIPANGFALVVDVAPATFRATYNVPAGVPVFGPYAGALDNSGENVELTMPGVPESGVTPDITVDRVVYAPTAPWPTAPNGTGRSLSRFTGTAYGNDPANWAADVVGGTPGLANLTTSPGVAAVAVNDGTGVPSAQRSKVGSVTVTFDRAVALDAGAATLVGRNGAGAGLTVSAANPSGDGTTWVLSFAGSAMVGGSVPDGVYDLTLSGPLVHGTAGGGNLPADYKFAFHRLFSDADGDGDSDNFDLLQLRATYLKPSTDPAYKASFDYDASGVVDNLDVFQIRSRRGVVFQGY